jgi:hypothetical protein
MNLKELIKQLTNEVLNENELNSISTMEKLIHQAEEDGYIFGDYGQYILDAAKVVANGFDKLPPEEQKVMRDTYYKAFLRRIGKINEDSGTSALGTVPSTPNWVTPPGQKKNKATKQAEKEGWKATKGETQMPGDSKVKDYKNLTGKKKKKVKIYHESNYNQPSKFQNAKYPYNDMYGGPSSATKGGGYYASATNENMNNTLANIIKEELLNEVTYSKFKNEVKNRTKAEQLHKAIREVKRKLQEIDRIVEYTSRMKEELSEGDGIQYWTRTNEAITTISEMVNILNNKIKNLQQ